MSPEPGRRALAGAALALLAIALLLAWAAATGAPSLRVPAPVAYLAAGALTLGAVQALQRLVAPSTSGDGLAALLLAALAAIGLWIALAPGVRVCAVGSRVDATTPITGLACRVPFGLGAGLMVLMAAAAAQRWWRARRAPAA